MGGSASAGFGKLVGFGAGALAIVGGLNTLKSAVASTFKIGMDFQSTINNLGAVTGSTGAVLDKVSVKARQLGSDIDLPAASASDAAAAMLELAKGGLSVQQSMDAAKGTLTLAAAAQIDGASAATIQSAALNTFGLSASSASHVADVLANTANAASGNITDFAAGLQQSGSVAAAFGISLDSTSTVLGLFAKNGIIGSDAGTSFKTMLTQLAAPTKVAKLAMEDLGLSVYDANGNFVGAEELTNQLAKAQGRLSQQQFNTAATTVFGSDALRGANILAKEGVKGYDSMAASVSKVGGAQVVATAQTKGLKGAIGLMKNAVQDVQLKAFDKLAPSVESAFRKIAGAIPGIADVVLPVFSNIVDGATGFFSKVSDIVGAFGPDNVKSVLDGGVKISGAVQSAFHDAFSDETLKFISDFGTQFVGRLVDLVGVVTKAAGDFVAPIIAGASTLVGKALPYVTAFVDQIGGAVGTAVKAVAPLGGVIGDLFKAMGNSGVLDTFGTALSGVGKSAQGAANLLTPVVGAASGILEGFSSLPGKAQGPLLALVAVFALSGPIGRIGVAIKSAMQTAYLNTLYGVDRIRGTMTAGIAGIAAAGKGLLAAFGGPLGLAIVGITTFLAFLPDLIKGNNAAANATDNNVSSVNALADAYKNSNGLVDENVRKTALAQLQNAKWGASSTDLTTYAGNLKDVGVTTRDLVDAEVGIPGASAKIEDSYNRRKAALQQIIEVNRKAAQSGGKDAAAQNDAADAAYASLKILDQQHGALQGLVGIQGEATAKWKANEDAVRADTSAIGGLGKAFNAATGAATRGSGGVSGLGLAAEAASIQLTNTGKAVSFVGDSALIAAGKQADTAKSAADTALAYKTIGVEAPAAAEGSTAVADALKGFADAANIADQNGQFFLLTMQRIGGKDISTQQALDANAAAIRGIGAAYRDTTQNAIDQRKAEADLATTRANLNKMTMVDKKDASGNTVKDSKGNAVKVSERASDATTLDDIAALELRVAAAKDKNAASQAGINEEMAKAQKSAATLVSSILQQEVKTKGLTVATKDAKAALAAQRVAFIEQVSTLGGTVVATDAAKAAANKLADQYGLVPKTVDTVITADTNLPAASVQHFKKLSDAATKARTAKFTADTKDALGTIGLYGQYLQGFPKTVKSKFDADVATAEANGQRLYRVYNATTRKWEAKFLTPNEAEARTKAGGVVEQYNRAKGTWTASFKAVTTAALADLAKYHGDIDKLPKNVKSKFNADVAAAEASGKHLYQTYDRTTGNRTALFLTPNQASAKQKAGYLVQQYDKARGTWTANLSAKDLASGKIDAVKRSLDLVKDKTVSLKVQMIADANGDLTARLNSDGSVRMADGLTAKAKGGMVNGAGTGTSDSILVRMSDGEGVNTAAAMQKPANRKAMHYMNAGGEIPGFATGGIVGSLGKRLIEMTTVGGNPGAAAAAAVAKIYSNADASTKAANAQFDAAKAMALAAQVSSGPSGLLGSQNPSEWGWNVGQGIVPFSFQGTPFPAGVAAGTESIWTSFLSQLVPTIPGGLRPGENWGYENRANVNSPGSKSFHAYGLALDVNAPENPNGSPPGNGLGQVPGTAGALARRFNMLWGGEFSGTKDAMHFELHQRPGGPSKNPASGNELGGGLTAGAAPAGSGVERWRSLATRVARAKGEDLASVQVMLNQMSRESSGNPRAINLTDINAQRGTPSVGLLQFIPATFKGNADPGFNADIYDPESQMRAWYNYINGKYSGYAKFGQRGYGAYATGGMVDGFGSGTSDSILARLSNGEGINTAQAMAKPSNRKAMHFMNAGGTVPGFAGGGIVGTSSQLGLSGRTAVSVGPELSNVVAALADIAQAVRDARDAVAGQRDAEVAAFSVLNAAKRLQYENQTAARNMLKAARDKQGTENAKTSARERLIDRQKVTAAERVLSRTVAADRAAVGKADREYRNARRTALSYEAAARAAERFQAAQQRAYRAQQQRAAQLDALTDRLGSASEKLNGLRSDRASLASSLASSVSGFDGGITGHNETRTTFATILKGQQYNAAQAQKFNVGITKLRALGLSNGSLNSIASAGVDGGGVTAAALAKASPKQIAQLNGTVDQMRRIGINVGNVVGGAFYDAGIQAAAGLVKGIQSQMAAIQKVMNSVAGAVVAALVRRLQIRSPSKVMEGHGFNTVQGYINGITGSTAGVTKAIENMVAVPPLANMTAVRNNLAGTSSIPKIEVQVLLDGQRIDDRVDIKINGFATELGHSLEKVSMQA